MAKRIEPPRRGRPPKNAAAMLSPVMVRFPREMIEAIDAIIDDRMDKPDRSSMIRELIAEALDARSRKGGKR